MSPSPGRESRRARIQESHGGSWGSSSSDFAHLAALLYERSREDAATTQTKNWSTYVFAGIPMLLSSLRCLMVEMEKWAPRDSGALEDLAANDEFQRMLKRYRVPAELQGDASDLYEVRNEILHPAHTPAGTEDNWPDYLRSLKSKGLLNTTGKHPDYIFFGQLASHKLFTWACGVVFRIAHCAVLSNDQKRPTFERFLSNYDFYDGCDGSFRRKFLEETQRDLDFLRSQGEL